MPKRIYEIASFNSGIVANPTDELDTPPNSASISLNIDPLADGELQGVPEDSFLKQSGFVQDFSLIDYEQPPEYATYNPTTRNAFEHQIL